MAFLGLALFTGLGLFVDLIEGFAIGLLTVLIGIVAFGRPLTRFAVMIIFYKQTVVCKLFVLFTNQSVLSI